MAAALEVYETAEAPECVCLSEDGWIAVMSRKRVTVMPAVEGALRAGRVRRGFADLHPDAEDTWATLEKHPTVASLVDARPVLHSHSADIESHLFLSAAWSPPGLGTGGSGPVLAVCASDHRIALFPLARTCGGELTPAPQFPVDLMHAQEADGGGEPARKRARGADPLPPPQADRLAWSAAWTDPTTGLARACLAGAGVRGAVLSVVEVGGAVPAVHILPLAGAVATAVAWSTVADSNGHARPALVLGCDDGSVLVWHGGPLPREREGGEAADPIAALPAATPVRLTPAQGQSGPCRPLRPVVSLVAHDTRADNSSGGGRDPHPPLAVWAVGTLLHSSPLPGPGGAPAGVSVSEEPGGGCAPLTALTVVRAASDGAQGAPGAVCVAAGDMAGCVRLWRCAAGRAPVPLTVLASLPHLVHGLASLPSGLGVLAASMIVPQSRGTVARALWERHTRLRLCAVPTRPMHDSGGGGAVGRGNGGAEEAEEEEEAGWEQEAMEEAVRKAVRRRLGASPAISPEAATHAASTLLQRHGCDPREVAVVGGHAMARAVLRVLLGWDARLPSPDDQQQQPQPQQQQQPPAGPVTDERDAERVMQCAVALERHAARHRSAAAAAAAAAAAPCPGSPSSHTSGSRAAAAPAPGADAATTVDAAGGDATAPLGSRESRRVLLWESARRVRARLLRRASAALRLQGAEGTDGGAVWDAAPELARCTARAAVWQACVCRLALGEAPTAAAGGEGAATTAEEAEAARARAAPEEGYRCVLEEGLGSPPLPLWSTQRREALQRDKAQAEAVLAVLGGDATPTLGRAPRGLAGHTHSAWAVRPASWPAAEEAGDELWLVQGVAAHSTERGGSRAGGMEEEEGEPLACVARDAVTCAPLDTWRTLQCVDCGAERAADPCPLWVAAGGGPDRCPLCAAWLE